MDTGNGYRTQNAVLCHVLINTTKVAQLAIQESDGGKLSFPLTTNTQCQCIPQGESLIKGCKPLSGIIGRFANISFPGQSVLLSMYELQHEPVH